MWTIENRVRYDRSKLRYPSDLTDEEWAIIEPLIPAGKRGGGKRTVVLREVVNGLMYVLSTGCQWRAVPKDLPPRSTLFGYFDLWNWDGSLGRIHAELYMKCREAMGREASPTAAVIDSQSVKGAEKGGVASTRAGMMLGMATTKALRRDQRQEAPYPCRHSRTATACACSPCRHSRPRRWASRSQDTVRALSVFEEAVRRRRLPGACLREGSEEGKAMCRDRNRQAIRRR